MNSIDKLLNIADSLHLEEQAVLLKVFKERIESSNQELLIPLVGEFSSGKTSFINALLDNKNLETASKSTTATIFEVRFGAEESRQEIVDTNGNLIETGVETLDNKKLKETEVVRVYDTSTKLDSSIVLVDTPGLSSNDPKHRIALSNYLPNADAILLVIDINQSATRSLISFVRDSQLSKRPLFLMLTKCDTKTQNEISQQIKNTVDTVGIPESNIICTSSDKGDLEQFYRIIAEMQTRKNQIVKDAISDRVRIIAEQMNEFIHELLKNLESPKDIERAISDQNCKLRQLNSNIDILIEDASASIERKEEDSILVFKNKVAPKLETILETEGRDCDHSVYSAVNTLGNLIIESFKRDIQSVIVNLARQRSHSMKEIPMQSLETIDLSGIAFNQFTYNLNLSDLGHEHDKLYGYAALGVAAVAAVAIAAPVAAGAAGAGAAGAAGTAGAGAASAGAAGAAGAASAAGTAEAATVASTIISETGEVVAGSLISRSIVKAATYARKVGDKMETIQSAEQELKEKTGMNRGLIETATGWFTDKIVGKAARRRAINNYIDETLVPEFRDLLYNVRTNLVRAIDDVIRQEASSMVSSMEQALAELKNQLDNSQQDVNERRQALKSYIEIINDYK